MLNSNINLIAKENNLNNNNVNVDNSNSDALKVKLLLTLHKRKAFATCSIKLIFLLKTHIEAFNKFIRI